MRSRRCQHSRLVAEGVDVEQRDDEAEQLKQRADRQAVAS